MVYLYWRWPGDREGGTGAPITERKAPYGSLGDARAQADHDLQVCADADDFAAAPIRIEDAGGSTLWTAGVPEGR